MRFMASRFADTWTVVIDDGHTTVVGTGETYDAALAGTGHRQPLDLTLFIAAIDAEGGGDISIQAAPAEVQIWIRFLPPFEQATTLVGRAPTVKAALEKLEVRRDQR